MPRTPPYLAPRPRYIDPDATEQARRLTESIPWPGGLGRLAAALPQANPDSETRVGRELEADPDAPRCHGPRADTCTQAPTGPCLPRVCPGCLSSDTAETYHHHCHDKAAQTPSTCARPQATEAAQACQAQTDPY